MDGGDSWGRLRDASGAIVPDAKVRVDGDANGVHLVALTQKDGGFVLLRVPAGVYSMTVEGSGLGKAAGAAGECRA